jgi:hypothetical protein
LFQDFHIVDFLSHCCEHDCTQEYLNAIWAS